MKQKLSFFRINEFPLIIGAITAVLLTLLGGGRIAALIVYSLIVSVCAVKYFSQFDFDIKDGEEAEKKRKALFSKAFNPIVSLTSAFIIIYVIGNVIKNRSGLQIPFITRGFSGSESLYSHIGSFLVALCIVLIMLRAICSLILKKGEMKSTMLILSAVYMPVLYEAIYLVIITVASLSLHVEIIHKAFFAFTILLFIVCAFICVASILKMRKTYIINEEPKKKFSVKKFLSSK